MSNSRRTGRRRHVMMSPEAILKKSARGWEILRFCKQNRVKLESKLEEGVLYVDAVVNGYRIWLVTLESGKMYVNHFAPQNIEDHINETSGR